jgi:hypothetical protein
VGFLLVVVREPLVEERELAEAVERDDLRGSVRE